MLWYEKHSVGAFYIPDTLGNFSQFIGERYIPSDSFVLCYEVSIFLRHPGYGVDEVIGLYGYDESCSQR